MYRVLIDTSAYEKEGCIFSGKKFDSLKKLSDEGFIRIITSQIILNEIESHINKSTASFSAALKKTIKDADHIVRVDLGPFADLKKNEKTLCETFRNQRVKKIHRFFDSIETEQLDNKHIDLNKVLENYFLEKPPFSGKKKSEFPDAFILDAFVNKYKSILEDACIVSCDDDFENFCEQDPKINNFKSIASFIDFINSKKEKLLFPRLHSAFENQLNDLRDRLSGWLYESLDFTYNDSWINPEAEIDEESIDIELRNPKLISHTNEAATFELNVRVRYDVNVSASDPESIIRDNETKDLFFLEPIYLFGTIEKQFDVVVECTFNLGNLELSFEIEPFDIPSFVYNLEDKDFKEVRDFDY